MKVYRIFWFIFFLALIISSSISARAEENISRLENFIAVMDIELGAGVDKALKVPLTQAIIDELVNTGKYQVIDRANRDKILAEQGLQMSECMSEECRVQAGRLLGVGKLVVGYVYKVASVYFATLQVINVETGKIENSIKHKCSCTVEDLLDVVPSIARKMVTGEGAPLAYGRKSGGLYVKSTPKGARIFIDGKEMPMKTPATIDGIAPGKHTIKVVKGNMSAQDEVIVNADEYTSVELELKAPSGRVNIISDPPDARVYVDGKYMGSTPLKVTIPYGKHSVEVSKKGFEKVTFTFNLKKPAVRLRAKLKPRGKKMARLDISTSPSGASVYIDGRLEGKTPIPSLDVEPGTHVISIRLEGYKEIRKKLALKEGESRMLMETLRPLGKKRVVKKGGVPLWKKILSWSGIVLGAACVGVGAWQLMLAKDDIENADWWYQEYQNATDPARIAEAWDWVVRESNYARQETIVGYSLIGTGVVSAGLGVYGVLTLSGGGSGTALMLDAPQRQHAMMLRVMFRP